VVTAAESPYDGTTFRPLADSALIDAGDMSYYVAATNGWPAAWLAECGKDYYGKDRVVNGTIDIGCVRTLGSSYVPALMSAFKEANTDKNIHFRLHGVGGLSAEIIEGLKNRQFDVAFCSKYRDDPMIDFVRIASQDLVMAVPLGHPLASQDTVRLQDTLKYPQILFDRRSGLRDIIDNLYAKIGDYPICEMEVEEDQVIAGLVAKGFGIAVIPNMHILETMELKTLRIVEPEPERDFYMASLKGTYFAPLVVSFRKFAENFHFDSRYIF
jgi:DNA-binding transcriptional LysR family regulator